MEQEKAYKMKGVGVVWRAALTLRSVQPQVKAGEQPAKWGSLILHKRKKKPVIG